MQYEDLLPTFIDVAGGKVPDVIDGKSLVDVFQGKTKTHHKLSLIHIFTKIYREKGWDEIREARRKRMTKLGIIDPNTEFAEWENRKWDELTEKEKDEVAYRMAVYAAQVHCVDYNVGKLLDLSLIHIFTDGIVLFGTREAECRTDYGR